MLGDTVTKILLTGFEPFDGDTSNPSGDAVREVAARYHGEAELITEVLPVTFGSAGDRLRELIAAHSPAIILAVGLAGGRPMLRLERVAVNLRDARIPDNDGNQPVDTPVVKHGQPALFTTLPVKAIARAIEAAGLTVELSLTAGAFVCNDIFYQALDAAEPGTRAGFLHVPWDTEHVRGATPSLPLADIVRGIEIALQTALEVQHDESYAAGATN